MTYLSVDEQDAAIRRAFPDFEPTAKADWIGIWEGPVKPAGKTYRIRIVYFRRTIFDGWMLENPYVTVHIVDPPIGAEALRDDKFLPHIYWNDRNPAWPALCLWDPKEMFWTPEQSIASTIIPWTSEWLLFFEYWQITGEFRGPGRHPDRRRNTCPKPNEDSDPATRVQRERLRYAEFHKLGRRTGVFGSYRWMAAASKDYSPPPSWPSSSGATSADDPSPPTSISLPALQPEASWRSVSEPA
jgi:hypothetical protein